MARVAGITLEKTYAGKPKAIRFDYNMYGGLLQNFFIQEGLEFPYSPYNKKEVERLLDTKSEMESGARRKVDMSNFWDE